MSQTKEVIESILAKASPIRLDQMDQVALQNRIDKKYILHIDRLAEVLELVIGHYRVLEIDEKRVFSYKTVYFDTPDHRFYHDHHNGMINRIKVRCRQYVESDRVYFEIKRKYQGYRTDKFRKSIPSVIDNLGIAEYDEVKARYKKYNVDNLNVTLHNFFYRVTLVSKRYTERVTLDFHLKFAKDGKTALIDDIAIIEVKQGKYDDKSPIVQVLKKERIYPNNISKYTYGVLLLGTGIKYNAFKALLNRVSKIQTSNGACKQPSVQEL
jgi:hypothetical protein